MVLDKFFDPKLLNMKPRYAVPTAFFFVILGFVCSYMIFSSQISIVMVAFSSFLILPYVMKIFEFDELDVSIDGTNKQDLEKWVVKCMKDGYSPKQVKDSIIKDNLENPYSLMYDLALIDEISLKEVKASNPIQRHNRTIALYSFLFVGMLLAYTILFNILPQPLKENVFFNQIGVVKPGYNTGLSRIAAFKTILTNNLIIIVICVFLSLIYGSGAIFILNYNASIAGVLFGGSIAPFLGRSGGFLDNPAMFIPHTIIEILAYLIAAIAGAILSKAAAQVLPGNPKILVKDGVIYLFISVLLIVVGAIVEVNILNLA